MGSKPIRTHRDLDVYKLAFSLARQIFRETKTFPTEERYSLTSRIRRSSRSVCAHLAEAWRKRRYEAVVATRSEEATYINPIPPIPHRPIRAVKGLKVQPINPG